MITALLRGLGYFAVLRPSFVFGTILVYLPLTVLDWVPGHNILGNLFVEYTFGWGFWFGLALYAAVWAVMLTTCLILDGERDRNRQLDRNRKPDQNSDPGQGGEPTPDSSVVYDPGPDQRQVTIPMRSASPFIWFSLLGLPGLLAVCWKADSAILAFLGLAVGVLTAYLFMEIPIYLIRCYDRKFQVLSWPPFGGYIPPQAWLGWISRGFWIFFSWIARWTPVSSHIFEDDPDKPNRKILKGDHFFAAAGLTSVAAAYIAMYFLLKPGSVIETESLPPAAFLYTLLLPIIWLLSGLWMHFRRYRIIVLLLVFLGVVFYTIGGTRWVESTTGGPAHTYDVYSLPHGIKPLRAVDVIRPLENLERPTLTIVAASGGGILAAGWTAKVLTQLHERCPSFRKELRLISSVSGGSVGAAHYVNAHGQGTVSLPPDRLASLVEDSMQTSLAITAYGFIFPDFRRALFPLWTDETFDRGRLAEADWRKTANLSSERHPADIVLLSEWREAIQDGSKPAVIFNATVMETGERVAMTPISSLASDWFGGKPDDQQPVMRRHDTKTLSTFLGQPDQYSLDIWTAARLSATFSYVSPAARATFVTDRQGNNILARRIPRDDKKERNGLFHLIDGGYHDNYGVSPALGWLEAAVNDLDPQQLPFTRIALIEIRASREAEPAPSGQWTAAWLGPVMGLLNSWGLSQTAANDTAVNRLIQPDKDSKELAPYHRKSKLYNVPFRSFVFVPQGKGPLSWHLSKVEKEFVHSSWETAENQAVLQKFQNFVECQ